MEVVEITSRALNNEDLHVAFMEYIERVFEKKIDHIIQVGLTLKIKFKEI